MVIHSITGGIKAQKRLLNIGLRVGDRVEIISNSGHGRVVVGVDCNRVMIGQGIARHIQAHPITGDDLLHECYEDEMGNHTNAPIPLSQIDRGRFATIVRIGGKRSLSRKLGHEDIYEGVEVFVKNLDLSENRVLISVHSRELTVDLTDADQIIVDWIR